MASTKKIWSRVLVLIRNNKQDVVSIYFFAILSGLIQLSIPVGIQAIVGFSFGAQMVVSIYVLIFILILGVLLVGILNINQLKIIEKMQQRIFTQNSIELSQKLLEINLQGYDKYYLPEKVNRYFETFNIQKGLAKLLVDIPVATIQIFLGLILLSFYDSSFVIFGIILLGIIWLILKYTSNAGLRTSIDESNDKYQVAAWIEDIARVIRSFKYSQGSDLNIRKTDDYIGKYLINRNKHFQVLLKQYIALVSYKVIITAAMLGIGSYLLVEQQINIGEFIAAEIVILTVIAATEKIITNLDSLYDVATGLEKIESLFEETNEPDGLIDWNPKQEGPKFEFRDFSFGYQTNQLVIKNASFRIPSNKITVISGNEGEGKTTLLKVIGSLYRTYNGSILMDEFEYSHYTIYSLRNNIGFYFRSHEIFNGTLYDNITLGNHSMNYEKLLILIKRLKFHSLLVNMKDGFNTLIDPMGSKLPTSQIKKILLLRAFSNEPKLLCLDEPFIAMGVEERQAILDYLKELKSNTTIVIISNEESLISCSDCKIQLKHNEILVN